MSRKGKNNHVKKQRDRRVIVTGHGPFDGLGLAFGGAVRADQGKTSRSDTEKTTAASIAIAVSLGLASGLLYLLLYEYQDEIVRLAQLTREGHKVDFIVPILIAFVFSVVHGTFTGRFWDTLGLKAKH